jgi:hypothetical protein
MRNIANEETIAINSSVNPSEKSSAVLLDIPKNNKDDFIPEKIVQE